MRTSITPRGQVEAAAIVLLGALNLLEDLDRPTSADAALRTVVVEYLTKLGIDRRQL